MRLTLTALALACCVLLGCVDARSEEQPAAEEGPITEAFKDLQRLSALQARLDSNVARISSYVQSSAPEDDLAQRSPSEGFTQQLLQDLIDVRVELLKIGKSLNVTMGDIVAAGMEMRKREEAISELKEQEQEFIVREALREGQVQVDYETGKVKAIEREDGEPETTIEEMVIEADPAMLHLDLELLQDVAVLALATSFIGAGVSFLSLPPMLGYLTAGMLVGPSCLNLITKVVEVETLAQFGSMFILFSRGLTYSSYYLSMQSTPQQPSVQATWAGVALIAISIVGWMAFTLFFELAGTLTQAFVTALCFSLSATSWVIDVISKSHVQGTRFGQVVLEMCRVQDLGMVPMLVAPAIIRHMFLDFSLLEVIRLLSLQIFGVLGIVAISRAIFPKLLSFMLQAKGSVATPFTTTTATTTSPHHNDTPTRAQSTPSSNRSYTADRTQHLFKRIVDHEHPAPEASAVALPAGEHTPDAALFAVVSCSAKQPHCVLLDAFWKVTLVCWWLPLADRLLHRTQLAHGVDGAVARYRRVVCRTRAARRAAHPARGIVDRPADFVFRRPVSGLDRHDHESGECLTAHQVDANGLSHRCRSCLFPMRSCLCWNTCFLLQEASSPFCC